MRVLTWNIGSFVFIKYARFFNLKWKDENVYHNYFQPALNGPFVSETIEKIDPDVIFLQEFWYPHDVEKIEALKKYPHKKLIDEWYKKQSVLVASKVPFHLGEEGIFSIVRFDKLHFIPIHLNSFHPSKKFTEATMLNKIVSEMKRVVVLGDSNIWSRGRVFLFLNDKRAYKKITELLVDISEKIISTTYLGFGLDKVFSSKDVLVQNIKSPRTRGQFMDHYPVYFDVESHRD